MNPKSTSQKPLTGPAARSTRVWLIGALAVAALATAFPLASDMGHRTAGAQSAPGDGPLPASGRWMTHANGDRVQRVIRVGDFAWAATDGGGVVRWNLKTAGYRQFLAPQDGLRSNRVYDIEAAADGTIWVATARGLSRLAPEAEAWLTIAPETSPGMPSRMVTAIEPAADGYLWVGFAQEWDPKLMNAKARTLGAFRGGGIARYHPADGKWDKAFRPEVENTSDGEKFKHIPSENVTELELNTAGALFVGTRPYHVWDLNACGDKDCLADPGYWGWTGGGLAAFDLATSKWIVWLPTGGGACFSDNITDLEPDVDGRMWVGTAGRGAMMIPKFQKTSCNSGTPYYTRGRKQNDRLFGMRGNWVASIAIDEQGRVWIGHGDGYDKGQGIAILTHNNTFHDSSAADNNGFGSDDIWDYVDFDGISGESNAMVTALVVDDAIKLMGTRDHKHGGGYGLRGYIEDEQQWIPLRTGDIGLPSNQIVAIAHDPAKEETWVSFKDRGIARFDGQRWHGSRMFGAGDKAATVTADTRDGFSRLKVNVPDRAAFDKIFPVLPSFLRIDNDPTYYRVTGYTAERAGIGPFLNIDPALVRDVTKGTSVYKVNRGPASDAATDLAIGADSHVWAGGRETIWTGDVCSDKKRLLGQCYLDGGLGEWDGTDWKVYDIDNSDLPDQTIPAVAIDLQGRIWAGTGDGRSSGQGIAVYDPAVKTWTLYDYATIPADQKMGSNGITDLAVDPVSGDVWASHSPVVIWKENLNGSFSRVYGGGGVSRWNGSRWQAWGKKAGATFKAFGEDGETTAVLPDRAHNRMWLGSWDAAASFHWLEGYGVNAVINWCPLDACTNAWESKIFPEDGLVSDIVLDYANRVWVGTHRNGAGKVPPIGGIKIYDGVDWFTYTPDNVPLPSNQITAMAQDGDAMWVGTLSDGIAVFDAVPPVTSTPEPTALPSFTPTPEVTDATPTPDELTPTSGTPTPGTPTSGTVEPTPSATAGTAATDLPMATRTPTATRRPPTDAACGKGTDRVCRIFVPSAKMTCARGLRCGRTTPRPLPPLFTPTPAGEPPTSAAPTDIPQTDVPPTAIPPTATSTVSPQATTTGATATVTEGPSSATPSATPTSTPSATATETAQGPTSTATAPATATDLPIKQWSIFSGQGFKLPTVDFYGVYGSGPNNVYFVGTSAAVLHWDGSKMTSVAVPVQDTLRTVHMWSATQGFIAGDGGAALELRSRRWVKVDVGTYSDNWKAVAGMLGPTGITGWLLGDDKGHRLRYTGSEFAPPSSADRNTAHKYTAVSMLSPTLAYAVQNNGNGSRVYTYNGADWSPGPATGALFDVHALSAQQGVAVGSRGAAWGINAEGRWAAMASKPATAGEDLKAVWMLAPDLIWAGGGKTGLYRFNGSSWIATTIQAGNKAIHDIWIAPDGSEGWAVGAGGLFLQYK